MITEGEGGRGEPDEGVGTEGPKNDYAGQVTYILVSSSLIVSRRTGQKRSGQAHLGGQCSQCAVHIAGSPLAKH